MGKFTVMDPYEEYRNASFIIEFDDKNEERMMHGEEPEGIIIPNFTPQQRAQITSGLGSLLKRLTRKV